MLLNSFSRGLKDLADGMQKDPKTTTISIIIGILIMMWLFHGC